METSEFMRLLRALTFSVETDSNSVSSNTNLYDYMLENFRIAGVIDYDE